MPNYQNGKIYCLRSHQTDKIYIGSTTLKLCTRMAKHRCNYRKSIDGTSSKDMLCYDDCYIELLELYPCNSKIELRKKEGEYIRKMDCINKNIPCRTKKEWYNDNKERLLLKRAKYYNENKIKHLEKCKEYNELNKDKISKRFKQKKLCECGSNVNIYNMNRHKKTKKHLKYIENN